MFAVKLLEQFGCFHRAFFFAQLLGVPVEFAEQTAVIDQAAGQNASVDAQFGGLHGAGDE